MASNWRADGTLRDYLVRHNIVAIADIDTRALTRVLRSAGVMRGVIATGAGRSRRSWSRRRARFRRWKAPTWCKDVTCDSAVRVARAARPHRAKPTSASSASRRSARAARRLRGRGLRLRHQVQHPAPARRLRLRRARVSRPTAPAADLLAIEPGRHLPEQRPRRSGGADVRHRQRRELVESERADVRHLPRPPDPRPGGRRRDVQAEVRPSRRQPSGQGAAARARWRSRRRTTASPSIPASLPADVAVTHLNLYDGTVEGFRHTDEADLLGAVPSRGVAGSARRRLPVPAVPRVDGEAMRRASLR